MNIDLLTKLVKLANNNPNENEANQAARKVCVMIEEAKFQFSDNSFDWKTTPITFDTHDILSRQQQEAQAKYYQDFINSVFGKQDAK